MSGLFFIPPDKRLHERFVEGWSFSGVWPTSTGLEQRQLALLSSDGKAIEAVALATRGRRRVATYTWHIAFEPVVPFDSEIELHEFVPLLQVATRAAVHAAVATGGAQLPDESLAEILAAIVSARPDAESQIDEIRRLLEVSPPLNVVEDESEPIVLYEGDAVALALEIGGFDRGQELQAWSGIPKAPFLDGIQEFRVSEEQLIDHDVRHFGDWKLVEDALVRGVTFASPKGNYLTVINVNREPVETTLGVDLIYYNHDYDSYVLVQYKRMTKVTGDSEFRPDSQLEEELVRMRAISLNGDEPSQSTGYRLDHRCCYLKLCWPTTREFHAGEIVPGMYFPLAYWDLLMASPVAVGPKGGQRLLGNTVGRRLNRTGFVGLVQDGWVGSRGVTTADIEEAIRSGLAAKKSIVLAAGRTGKRDEDEDNEDEHES